MNRVFFLSVLVISSLFFTSCSKEKGIDKDSLIVDSASAQKAFAEVLSKAVSENPSLRSYIYTEALEQFDNDYDVFYPFVKNQIVDGKHTFRDILLKFTDEESLAAIEIALPKLTILVPDWSWLGCFSINSWDPSSDVAVSFNIPQGYIGVYYQGEYLGELPDGSFPDFPVLIIKENERILYSPDTKGSGGQFEFVDSAFNNTQTRSIQHQFENIPIDGTPDISNFVPEGEVNYRVKEAFSYFPGSQAIYQRDYLYYNMTAQNQTKCRNENIWECLYKFKFRDYNSSFIHDDFTLMDSPGSNNPYYYWYDFEDHLENRTLDYKKNKSPKSPEELRSNFYAEGKLDLMFLISIPGKTSGTVYPTTKVKSVSFSDVFAIDHVDLNYRHRTLFVKDWYVYSINRSYIKPRWCYLNCQLPRWDISQESAMITVCVTEFDETGSSEIQFNAKRTVTNNFKSDVEVSGIPIGETTKAKVNLGYAYTDAHDMGETVKYSRGQGGIDNLGTAEWEYLTPIVLNRTSKNGKWGYEINYITTGTVDLMIIPVSY